MRPKSFLSVHLYAIVVTSVFGAASAATFAAESANTPNPADPSAPVPATTYQSALPGTKGQYLKNTDVERLPWRQLFEADGRFAAEPATGADSTNKTSEPSTTMPIVSAKPASSTSSDARGVIRSIDMKRGKVKLKHGPIEKLDMPGMTMVFRIKDPRLLEQVNKGDEVGFTIEMDRGAFYITGFQK